jgi:hypothetical protein
VTFLRNPPAKGHLLALDIVKLLGPLVAGRRE